MNLLNSPCLRRIYNVLRIGSLVLLSSCQSDLPVLNPSGGYEYQFHSFTLEADSSRSYQIEPKISSSPRLNTGIINTNDTVYTLLRL